MFLDFLFLHFKTSFKSYYNVPNKRNQHADFGCTKNYFDYLKIRSWLGLWSVVENPPSLEFAELVIWLFTQLWCRDTSSPAPTFGEAEEGALLDLKLSEVREEEQVLFASASDAGRKIAGILRRTFRT